MNVSENLSRFQLEDADSACWVLFRVVAKYFGLQGCFSL